MPRARKNVVLKPAVTLETSSDSSASTSSSSSGSSFRPPDIRSYLDSRLGLSEMDGDEKAEPATAASIDYGRLPKFSGLETDALAVERFIDKFELHLDSRNITDTKRRATTLAICLSGPAEQWYFNLSATDRVDYDKVKAALKNTYAPPSDHVQFLYRQQFYNRKQSPTESVAQYEIGLRELIRRAGVTLSDQEVVQLFVGNIRPDIRIRLQYDSATSTAADVLKKCQRIEKELLLYSQATGQHTIAAIGSNPIPYSTIPIHSTLTPPTPSVTPILSYTNNPQPQSSNPTVELLSALQQRLDKQDKLIEQLVLSQATGSQASNRSEGQGRGQLSREVDEGHEVSIAPGGPQYVSNRGRGGSRGRGRGRGGVPPGRCRICREHGHWQNDCPYRQVTVNNTQLQHPNRIPQALPNNAYTMQQQLYPNNQLQYQSMSSQSYNPYIQQLSTPQQFPSNVMTIPQQFPSNVMPIPQQYQAQMMQPQYTPQYSGQLSQLPQPTPNSSQQQLQQPGTLAALLSTPSSTVSTSTISVGTLGDGAPKVELVVAGLPKPLAFLVDTGSGICCISLDVYRAIQPPPSILPYTLPIQSVEGNQLSPIGYCTLQVACGNQTLSFPVVVFNNLPATAILGWDMLSRFRTVIDPATHQMKLSDVCFPLISASTNPAVRAICSITLPPTNSVITEGQVKLDKPVTQAQSQSLWMLEPRTNLHKEVHATPAVYELKEGDNNIVVPVRLVNDGHDPVTVSIGTVVGYLEAATVLPESTTVASLSVGAGCDPQSLHQQATEVASAGLLATGIVGEDGKAVAVQQQCISTAPAMHQHPTSNASAVSVNANPTTTTTTETEEEIRKREAEYERRYNVLANKLSHLSDTLQRSWMQLFLKHWNVWAFEENELRSTNIVEHNIQLRSGCIPSKRWPRPLAPKEQDAIDSQMKELIDNSKVKKVQSEWAAVPVLVSKKDGTLRMCVDYRKLNLHTIQDVYPLPNIDSTLQRLMGSSVFSTFDMRSGFHQIRMAKDSIPLTAFVVEGRYRGTWAYTVMPFGLTGAPSTFQRLIDTVLYPIQDIATGFFDDINVHSVDMEIHFVDVDTFLTHIEQANLKLKPTKCSFVCTEVKYLGKLVSHKQVRPDPDKVTAIDEYPTPNTLPQVRAFIGLVGYYRTHIAKFSDIATPLYALTRKNARWIWTDVEMSAFQQLKNALVSADVLIAPDFHRPLILTTDASTVAISGILSQECTINGVTMDRPIAYYSRLLQGAERSWHTTEQEAFAIVSSVRHFHQYIYGQTVYLRSDHAALKYLATADLKSRKLIRWAIELSEYGLIVQHKPGKEMPHVDALTRCYSVTNPLPAIPTIFIDQDDTGSVNCVRTGDNTDSVMQLDEKRNDPSAMHGNCIDNVATLNAISNEDVKNAPSLKLQSSSNAVAMDTYTNMNMKMDMNHMSNPSSINNNDGQKMKIGESSGNTLRNKTASDRMPQHENDEDNENRSKSVSIVAVIDSTQADWIELLNECVYIVNPIDRVDIITIAATTRGQHHHLQACQQTPHTAIHTHPSSTHVSPSSATTSTTPVNASASSSSTSATTTDTHRSYTTTTNTHRSESDADHKTPIDTNLQSSIDHTMSPPTTTAHQRAGLDSIAHDRRVHESTMHRTSLPHHTGHASSSHSTPPSQQSPDADAMNYQPGSTDNEALYEQFTNNATVVAEQLNDNAGEQAQHTNSSGVRLGSGTQYEDGEIPEDVTVGTEGAMSVMENEAVLRYVADLQSKDPAIEQLLATGSAEVTKGPDGLVYYGPSIIYAPSALVPTLLYLSHTSQLAGHSHWQRCYELLKRRWYWQDMRQAVKQFVRSCLECQSVNPSTRTVPSFRSWTGTETLRPWSFLAVDYIGPLIEAKPQQTRYILTIVCLFTKAVELIPTRSARARAVGEAILQRVICRHGVPSKILSDRGSHFISRVIGHMYSSLNIKQVLTSGYRPQTNGTCEKINGVVINKLSKLCAGSPRRWASLLPFVQFAINTTVSSATGYTPFYLCHGREAVLPTDLLSGSSPNPDATIDELVISLHKAIVSVNDATHKRVRAPSVPLYSIGDLVLYADPAKQLPKLAPRFVGPYVVDDIVTPVTFRVHKVNGPSRHRSVLHARFLKPYFTV